MKQYIEGIRTIPPEGIPGDFVRIALDDFAGTEQELIDHVKTLMSGSYVIKRHYCCHDEKKPCTAETVFESVT